MKKIIYGLLFLTFFISSFANAQWVVHQAPTNATLFDIEFYNKNTGWAVGENGTLLKTTNGGINWTLLINPAYNSNKILNAISIVDSVTYYFVGAHSTYIKTTNDGQTWIEIRNGPYGSGMGFLSVYYLNKDTGWACGNYRVLRTTNGGISFDSAGIYWTLLDIYFKDFNNGLISGDGRVFKTTDGGLNWYDSGVPVGGWLYFFRKLAVVNNQYVWVIGNSSDKVFKSTNFANSWILIDSTELDGAGGIAFSSLNTGWAGGINYLMKTTNGGYNWAFENIGTTLISNITSIEFVNDSIGWFVGGYGRVFHTTTGGQTMTGVFSYEHSIPEEFKLEQNFPNPFNSITTIRYEINKSGYYSLKLIDIRGKILRIISDGYIVPGKYQAKINIDEYPSGVYFCRLSSFNKTISRKLILMK